MSGTQRNRVSWHCRVERIGRSGTGSGSLRLQFFNFCCSLFLEDIKFLTEFLLQFRSHCPEFLEKLGYLTFLSEKTHSRILYIFLCLALEFLDLGKNLLYFLFHNLMLRKYTCPISG